MSEVDALEAALTRFERERPRFKRAGRAVEALVRDVVAEHRLSARLSYRVKDVQSYRSKVLSKENYTDPWNDVTDKVGVRALVDVADDVDRVHEAIRASTLTIVDVTDKRKQLKLEELGYSGLHLDLVAPAEDGDTEPVQCELQIRTIAQDAWSVVSHKLLYKPKVALPDQDQRALMRLVALVEIFDEEVARVIKSSASTSETVELVGAASTQYARFASNDSSVELSNRIVQVLEPVLPESVDAFIASLNDYVLSNMDTLTSMYAEYGAGSAMDTVSDYVLFSQPESLIILYLLDHYRVHDLQAAWNGAGLPLSWLRPIAALADNPLDL